ncbi:MAG: hypothetical protein QXX16_00395 [Nitrososphaerota archaeon]
MLVRGMSEREVLKHFRRSIPLWAGNSIEVIGIFLGAIMLCLVSLMYNPLLRLVSLFVAWLCFWYFSHCLAHYIVGRLLGVNYLYYYFGRSSLIKLNLRPISFIMKFVPVLGIKIDKASFKNVSRYRKAATYASGAFASMLAPLIPFIYSAIYLDLFTTLAFGFITFGNIIFTLYFSSKVGDLSRARKALRQDQNNL